MIRHILHYLTEHPDAKDTIQGILRWWLPKNPVQRREEEVREAVDGLVARGWVTKRQITPSRSIYGMNKEKLEEIKVFLREHESEAEGQRE
jgi:hypothetical protein